MAMKLSNKDKAIRDSLQNPKAVARFMKKLDHMEDGCIEWTGYTTEKGYGVFGLHTKDNPMCAVRAHRFSYALANGFDKLPVGTDTTQRRSVLHHKCENKSCVNPTHLEVVSDRWNLGRVNDKDMF